VSDGAAPTPPAEARRAWLLLGLGSGLFLAYLWFYVPRLNNYVMGDREFTGWVGPIAERLAGGARAYVDFVLPIPPGSFLLLAAIQKVTGQALLLQELWVAALAHFTMGLLGYAIAAPLTTRRNAVLVAVGTWVLAAYTPKECVYDQTSQLAAWGSIAVGVQALLAEPGRGGFRWFVVGALTVLTLGFKQSTFVGIALGWGLGFLYLALTDAREHGAAALRARSQDAARCLAGALVGLLLVIAMVHVAGGTWTDFLQATIGDGPELKGGRLSLVRNLYNYVVRQDAIRVALVPTAIVAAIAVRLGRAQGTFHAGDEPERPAGLSRRATGLIAVGLVALFGTAIALLVGEVRAMPRVFTATADTLRNVPAYGFVFGTLFFLGHLGGGQRRRARRRVGHTMNALAIVVMTSSMLYNTSFIQFSPFYYNNPDIPLALLFLFMATERARLPGATALVFALSVLPLFGIKLNRALSADRLVAHGHWAGLRVNVRGEELLKAAARVQQLVGPGETALMLPEDVQFVGLMQRPRPPVRGAILFVDQYSRRLLDEDLATLDRHLPKVIVIHPRRRRDWHTLYHTWSKSSAAQAVLDHVLDDLLPKHYRRDRSYPTIYFWDQGQLDLWVRKEE
jgi:hypothetical protein